MYFCKSLFSCMVFTLKLFRLLGIVFLLKEIRVIKKLGIQILQISLLLFCCMISSYVGVFISFYLAESHVTHTR